MTANELIEKYNIVRKDDMICVKEYYSAKRDDMLNELRERKPEIMEQLIENENEEHRAYEERKRKIEEIEGLAEIKSAMRDIEDWHEEFDKSFEDVGGMGVRPKPDYDIKAMREKYPRADAYLKAEKEANKWNYELSAIGKKALDKIINEPEGYKDAIKQMNKEIKDFTQEHLFD